jgi:undecaprenyl-diphosphatase
VPDLLKAVILGIVQGLTEFLPVSSTGHLILTEEALGVSESEFGLRFDAALHLGTLAAVLIYFHTLIANLIVAWFESVRRRSWSVTTESRLAWLLIIGTIPAGIAGYFLESTAEDAFRSPALVGATLILFCIPMVLAERYGRGNRALDSATPVDAVVVGIAQSIALVPGVSRSGITISAGMLSGFRREEAAVFAFLLSAPVIAAAGGKQIFDIVTGDNGPSGLENEFLVYLSGLLTAAIVGYSAIYFLVRYLRSNPLYLFIAYRIALGLLVLALAAGGVF